jgi:hypothetical protein
MNNKDTIIEALTMQLRIEREGNLALAKQAKPNCENCESLRKAAWDRIAELEDALENAVLAEREACVKVCEDINIEFAGEDVLATWCARAILARGEK